MIKQRKSIQWIPIIGKEIGDHQTHFGEQHIMEMQDYLEYRVIVEMILPAVSDNQLTLNADNVQ